MCIELSTRRQNEGEQNGEFTNMCFSTFRETWWEDLLRNVRVLSDAASQISKKFSANVYIVRFALESVGATPSLSSTVSTTIV